MEYGEKATKIRLAYEEFANRNKGKTLSKQAIDDGAQSLLDFDINGELCVSDFALPEASKTRSKYNKILFERTDIDGIYLVLGVKEND